MLSHYDLSYKCTATTNSESVRSNHILVRTKPAKCHGEYVSLIIGPNHGWLCLTSHRQRGHLETAPPFIVPCEGREAR